MKLHHRNPGPGSGGRWGLALALLAAAIPWAATAAVTLETAALDAAGGLQVQGKADASAPVELYDINGRRLWSGAGPSFTASLAASQLTAAPCAVRAVSNGTEAILDVSGAPAACKQAPTCSITALNDGAVVATGAKATFRARVSATKAFPIRYEWDFGGSVLGFPGGKLKAAGEVSKEVRFVRDHGTYRVRFVATDRRGGAAKTRCRSASARRPRRPRAWPSWRRRRRASRPSPAAS